MKIAVTILPGAPLKNLKAALAQVAMEHDLDIEVRPLIAE